MTDKVFTADARLVALVKHSHLTEEAKKHVLDTYTSSLRTGDSADVVAFIKSLVSSASVIPLPQYPLWCLPNFISITNTRAEAEAHYINRNKLIMSLGRVGDGDNQLYRFLTNYYDYMYIDSRCLCEMLTKRTPGLNRLKIEKDFGAGKVGRAMLISDQNGHPYIMKIMTNPKTASAFSLELRNATPGNLVAEAIATADKKILVAGGDNFTNQTVMHILLNFLLDDSLNYVHQHDAFMCGDNAINIMDIANQGDMYKYLNSLPTDADRLSACEECIRQLLPVLSYLKTPDIGFMHNDLKLKNVFVHKTDEGTVFYRLADFDKSAMSWRCVRFYNNTSFVQVAPCVYHGIYPVKLSGGFCSTISRSTDLNGKNISLYTMFNPEGYYLGYDLYTLVASMLFHPGVYRSLTGSGFMNEVIKTIDKGNFMTVIKKYNEEDRKTHGETLQSITIINGILHKNNVEIRNDYDNIMKELRLPKFKPSPSAASFFALASDKSIRPAISKTGKICLSAPYVEEGQRRCKTPRYRGWTGISYQYDEIAGK